MVLCINFYSHPPALYILYSRFCCLALADVTVTSSVVVFRRINTPRKAGGLGDMDIPILGDKTLEISRMYGVLKEDEGIAFR